MHEKTKIFRTAEATIKKPYAPKLILMFRYAKTKNTKNMRTNVKKIFNVFKSNGFVYASDENMLCVPWRTRVTKTMVKGYTNQQRPMSFKSALLFAVGRTPVKHISKRTMMIEKRENVMVDVSETQKSISPILKKR